MLVAPQVLARTKTVEEKREFRSSFGCSKEVFYYVWVMAKFPKTTQQKHLLWGLHFLRKYPEEDVMALFFGGSRPTIRKHVWIVVRAIAKLFPIIVSYSCCTDKHMKLFLLGSLVSVSVR